MSGGMWEAVRRETARKEQLPKLARLLAEESEKISTAHGLPEEECVAYDNLTEDQLVMFNELAEAVMSRLTVHSGGFIVVKEEGT